MTGFRKYFMNMLVLVLRQHNRNLFFQTLSLAHISRNLDLQNTIMNAYLQVLLSELESSVGVENLERRELSAVGVYALFSSEYNITVAQRGVLLSFCKSALDPKLSSTGVITKCGISILKRIYDGGHLWVEFFHLYETLEEPQSHLVKPILQKFNTLISEVGVAVFDTEQPTTITEADQTKQDLQSVIGNLSRKYAVPESAGVKFDCYWLLVLFDKAFFHPNGWIRVWSLQTFITLPPSLIVDKNHSTEPYIDQIRVTENFRMGLESLLHAFIVDVQKFLDGWVDRILLLDNYIADTFVENLCECVSSHPWSSAGMFFLSHMVARIPALRRSCSETDSLLQQAKLILRQSREVSVVYLRLAVQQNWMVFFLRNFTGTEDELLIWLPPLLDLIPSELLIESGVVWSECQRVFCRLKLENSSCSSFFSRAQECERNGPWNRKKQLADICIMHVLSWTENSVWVEKLKSTIGAAFHEINERSYADMSQLDWYLLLLQSFNSSSISKVFDDLELNKLIFSFLEQQIYAMNLTTAHHERFTSLLLPCWKYLGRLNNWNLTKERKFLDKLRGWALENSDKAFIAAELLADRECSLEIPPADITQHIEKLSFPQLVMDDADGDKNERLKAAVIRSQFIADTWKLLENVVNESQGAVSEQLLQCWMESLEYIKDHLHLISVVNIPQILLPKVESNDELVTEVVRVCVSSAKEFYRSELYLPALTGVCDAIFQTSVLRNPKTNECLLQTSQKLLTHGETNANVAVMLAKSLAKVFQSREEFSCGELVNGWMELLVTIATFGPASNRRQERTSDVASHFVEFCNTEYDANRIQQQKREHHSLQITRVYGVSTLTHVVHHNPHLAATLLDTVIAASTTEAVAKTQSFGLSLGHRLKTRLLQLLLLVDSHFNEKSTELLFGQCVEWLEEESQQCSVRLLSEWLLLRSIHRYPSLFLEKFLNSETQLATRRIGSVASWLTILLHLSLMFRTNKEEYASKLCNLEAMLLRAMPWCTTQHFVVRCTALAVLKRLWLLGMEEGGKLESSVLKPAFKSLAEFKLENRNSRRVVDKLLADFYFQQFHPLLDYSLENILIAFPKHTGMPKEELLRVEWFKAVNSCPAHIPYTPHGRTSLVDSVSDTWKGNQRVSDLIPLDSKEKDRKEGFQKKLTGPAVAELDREMVSVLLKDKHNATDKNNSLVVIASLIEKGSNLGGLCRSCEIFGVDEFVVDSLRAVEDPQFKSLSVTAQNWIKITQVKNYDVAEYLEQKKTDGFVIVGVEQTSNSQSLDNFTFPHKTILLLGNEKEGIPLELIRCLDVCVEIPQLGLIRSLNVHVSGALLMWEFAKQLKLPRKKTD